MNAFRSLIHSACLTILCAVLSTGSALAETRVANWEEHRTNSRHLNNIYLRHDVLAHLMTGELHITWSSGSAPTGAEISITNGGLPTAFDVDLHLDASVSPPRLTLNKHATGVVSLISNVGEPVLPYNSPKILEFSYVTSPANANKPNEAVFRFVIDVKDTGLSFGNTTPAGGIGGGAFGFGGAGIQTTPELGWASKLTSAPGAKYDANGFLTAWTRNFSDSYECWKMPIKVFPSGTCVENAIDVNFDSLPEGNLTTQPLAPGLTITAKSAKNTAMIWDTNPGTYSHMTSLLTPRKLVPGLTGLGEGLVRPSFFNVLVSNQAYLSAYGVNNVKNQKKVLALSATTDTGVKPWPIQSGGTISFTSQYPFKFGGFSIGNVQIGGTYEGYLNGVAKFSQMIVPMGDDRDVTKATLYGRNSVQQLLGPDGVAPDVNEIKITVNAENGQNGDFWIDDFRYCQAKLDCNNVPGGTAVVDACGVCGGNNSTCCPAGQSFDVNHVCCPDSAKDCAGVCNGGKVRDQYAGCCLPNKIDLCGKCDGGNSCTDCAGVPHGTWEEDKNGTCCAPEKIDNCDVCDGHNACIPTPTPTPTPSPTPTPTPSLTPTPTPTPVCTPPAVLVCSHKLNALPTDCECVVPTPTPTPTPVCPNNGKKDVCGVCDGDGTSCCTLTDQTGKQMSVDGDLHDQYWRGLQLNRRLNLSLQREGKLTTKAKAQIAAFRHDLTEGLNQGWIATWTKLISVQKVCEGETSCIQVDNVSALESIAAKSTDLNAVVHSIAKRLQKVVNKSRKDDKKLVKAADRAHEKTLKTLGEFPKSSCQI